MVASSDHPGGGGMQRRQRTNRRRTGPRPVERLVERLENRHALAVSFAAGAWTIVGDADAAHCDDTIVVERNPANARQLRATVNGIVVDVRSEARMKSIHIVGGAGDDSIIIDVPGNSRIATRLEGGYGADAITGGDGADVINGGPGRDTACAVGSAGEPHLAHERVRDERVARLVAVAGDDVEAAGRQPRLRRQFAEAQQR